MILNKWPKGGILRGFFATLEAPRDIQVRIMRTAQYGLPAPSRAPLMPETPLLSRKVQRIDFAEIESRVAARLMNLPQFSGTLHENLAQLGAHCTGECGDRSLMGSCDTCAPHQGTSGGR